MIARDEHDDDDDGDHDDHVDHDHDDYFYVQISNKNSGKLSSARRGSVELS